MEINRRGLLITWTGNSRVDSPAITDEIMQIVRNAGCRRIDFGVESGSQKVLDEIRKKTNLEQIIRAHHTAHSNGLATTTLMMVGHPSENFHDYMKSIRLLFFLESEKGGPMVLE